MLLSSLGFSKQLEVLIIVLFGISVFAFDTSILHVHKDLKELWSYEFDPKFHENSVDVYLKYIITGVVLIRTLTAHIFLACYVVMLWPAMFADRPNLILPWLVVGSVRSVLVNFVTLTTGSTMCVILKGYHSNCLDFILSQIIQHGPAVYAWLTVLGYYQDLRRYCEQKQNKSRDFHIVSHRRRSRSFTGPEVHFSEKFVDKTLLKRYSSDFTLEILNDEDDNTNEAVAKPFKSVDTFFKSKSQAKNQFANNERDVNGETTNNEEKCLFKRAMAMFNLTYEDISKLRRENSRCCLDNNENVDERIISSVSLNANEKMEEETCLNTLKNPICNFPVKITTMDTKNGCQCTFDDTS